MIKRLVTPKKKITLTTKRKPAPASLVAQKAWGGLSKLVKGELRKTLPDRDKDGVPNGFDCKPLNRRKQEAFLSDDARYLNDHPNIELGEHIDDGAFGAVYGVKNREDKLVVKVPLVYTQLSKYKKQYRSDALRASSAYIEPESWAYEDFNLENAPLVAPTKTVQITKDGNTFIGLVRPRVTVFGVRRNELKPTPEQFEYIRRRVITLSHSGIVIKDGLQVGLDRHGRILLFDIGDIKSRTVSEAFKINSEKWKEFLQMFYTGTKIYGKIDPNERW